MKITQKVTDRVVTLRALAQDTRIRIIWLLLQSPLDSREIAKRLGVSRDSASKHFDVLRKAGLLELKAEQRYALRGTIRRLKTGTVLDLGWCQFYFGPHPR